MNTLRDRIKYEIKTESIKHTFTAEDKTNIEKLVIAGEICSAKEESSEVHVKNEEVWIEAHNNVEVNTVFVKQELFACEVCAYSTTSVDEMQLHSNSHSEDKYACDVCTFRTKHALILMRHMKKHSQVEQYKCDKCSFSCKLEDDLQLHKEAHYNYSCSICDFKCLHHKEFVQHNIEAHTYSCNYCDYKAHKPENLQQHLKFHKRLIKIADSYAKFKTLCRLCLFQSDDKSVFYDHIRSHCINEPLSCHLCDYVCLIKLDLRNHLNIVHNLPTNKITNLFYPHTCKYCHYKNSSPIRVSLHTAQIHYKPMGLLTCDKCGSPHKSLYQLQKHMKQDHQDCFYQKCNLCSYRTSLMSHLYKHKRAHNQGFYKCEVCNWKTLKFHFLRDHLKMVHKIVITQSFLNKELKTTKCRVSCKLCSFRTVNINRLYTHMRTSHEKPLKCLHCSFRCKKIQVLFQHLKRLHGDNSVAVNNSSVMKHNQKPKLWTSKILYKCTICPCKGFFTPVKNHIRSHGIKKETMKSIKCKLCNVTFRSTRGYGRHIDRHQKYGNEPQFCDLCHYVGRNPIDLKNHKKVHRYNKVYYCNYCDLKRSFRQALVVHTLKMHHDELKMRGKDPIQIKQETFTQD